MHFPVKMKPLSRSVRGTVRALLLTSAVLAGASLCAQEPAKPVKPSIEPLVESVVEYLNLPSAVSFRDITSPHASDDIRHLQQTYGGVDIDQAVIAVRLNAQGGIKQVYGEVVSTPTNSLFGPVQKEMSLAESVESSLDAIAHMHLNALEDGKWQISHWQQKPVIYIDSGKPIESIVVTFSAENVTTGRIARPKLVINHQTGRILNAEDEIRWSTQAGSGLGGNTQTGQHDYTFVAGATDALTSSTFLVTRDATSCAMKVEPNMGEWQNNVTVIKGKDATEAYEFDCTEVNVDSDNTGFHDENLVGTLNAYSPINDAAFHAQVAFNLYERFSVTQALGPLKEMGRPLVVRVHYTTNAFPSDNAFWNGEFIALGDGFRSFLPKVSADTLGHELAHAFLEKYSLINQNAGIPLGISESFADIAGEATEYAIALTRSSTNDWKYAAETFKPTLDDAARYFEQPSLDGNSIDSAKAWHIHVKGHYQAGPMNKAYFHLITENADWNPIIGFDLWITAAADCWVTGIGYQQAAQCIVDSAETFRANNTELAVGWSAADIRAALIQAFAKADIMTTTETERVALFDYERYFDDLRLVNQSSLSSNDSVNFEWSARNFSNVAFQTTTLDEPVIIPIQDSETEIDLQLTLTQQNETQVYQRQIDLASDYCVPPRSDNSTDHIQQVGLNEELYAETSADPDGYGDHTDQPPLTFYVDATNVLTIKSNNTENTYWAAYIDSDGDHTFDAATEALFERVRSEGDQTIEFVSSLPQEIVGKHTRLRVLRNWSSQTDPCVGKLFGEYEDYRIELANAPVPAALFTAEVQSESYRVAFANESERIPEGATWLWRYKTTGSDWQDLSTDENPVFDFQQPGEFSIELQLITSDSTVYRIEQNITLAMVDPVVDFDFTITKKSAKVTFLNTSTTYLSDAQWQWDYGDGNTKTYDQFVASHQYTYDVDELSDDIDEITVRLKVTQNGQTFTEEKTMDRSSLPEGGSLAWAFPLFIWLFLIRKCTHRTARN